MLETEIKSIKQIFNKRGHNFKFLKIVTLAKQYVIHGKITSNDKKLSDLEEMNDVIMHTSKICGMSRATINFNVETMTANLKFYKKIKQVL